MENRILLHIPFDFSVPESGSRVRARAVSDTFTALFPGTELLCPGPGRGYTGRVRELSAGSALSDFAYCYSEPGTMPLSKTEYRLFRALRRSGTPVGVFYRDMCWKYGIWNPEWSADRRRRSIRRYRRDLRLFRQTADILFCPTASFAGQVPVHMRRELLPPGGPPGHLPAASLFDNRQVIYVGGINPRLGTDLLLDVMHRVNRITAVPLTLVTRPDDAAALRERLRTAGGEPAWLKLADAAGSGLGRLYRSASLAIIPRPADNEYNGIAFPVKLMEYLSYGLPVVATECREQAAFLRQTGTGVSAGTADGLAGEIIRLTSDRAAYDRMAAAVRGRFKEHDTWAHRVRTVDTLLRQVCKTPLPAFLRPFTRLLPVPGIS